MCALKPVHTEAHLDHSAQYGLQRLNLPMLQHSHVDDASLALEVCNTLNGVQKMIKSLQRPEAPAQFSSAQVVTERHFSALGSCDFQSLSNFLVVAPLVFCESDGPQKEVDTKTSIEGSMQRKDVGIEENCGLKEKRSWGQSCRIRLRLVTLMSTYRSVADDLQHLKLAKHLDDLQAPT